MKKALILLMVILICLNGYSQEKNFIDQPYLETSATFDTLVTPDKISISIVLNEADSKNKKSTEELEQQLAQKLKELNIDTEKDLTLLDYSSSFKGYFLKGQNILKIKNYSLLVHDATTAAKVLAGLEDIGISNVNIEKTEYSKAVQLILELKSKAILKAKQNADRLVEPLNQKIGKAIYISDNNSVTNALQGKVAGIQIRGAYLYGSRAEEPILVDFQKIKFESQVTVRFIIQ
jgi:uncharacterized protein YggE